MRLGFPDSELERLFGCLGKLMPHVRRDDFAVTGGVAIEFGLAEIGRPGYRTTVADLDCLVSSLDAIAPSVCNSFLVSHYHVAGARVPKFMVQLVDPISAMRVDVFPDFVGSVARAGLVQIGAEHVKMIALDDILTHKLLTISKASPTQPVDPKHANDAYVLGEVLGRRIPAVSRECLAKDIYGTDDFPCGRCALSRDPAFPVAPKREIFTLLGWTLGADLLPTAVRDISGSNERMWK